MNRAKEKFECQCGNYDTDLKIEFDEKGAYCPKCGGYCILVADNWKDKTCETCEYRVEEDCRKYPRWVDTIVKVENKLEWINKYTPACSEYKEKKG